MVDVILWVLRLFQKPVRPGAPIMLDDEQSGGAKFGTYGCMVVRGGSRLIVSCAHVFEEGKAGDAVAWLNVRRKLPGRVIGVLDSKSKSIDLALIATRRSARVVPAFPRAVGRVDPSPFPIGELSFVPKNALQGRVHVQALGASSGHTTGFAATGVFAILTHSGSAKKGKSAKSKATVYSISPPYIEVKPDYEKTADFCKEGDSGALLLTTGSGSLPQPLGLLVASRHDGLGDFGLAVPIERVLNEIGGGVRIDTGF